MSRGEQTARLGSWWSPPGGGTLWALPSKDFKIFAQLPCHTQGLEYAFKKGFWQSVGGIEKLWYQKQRLPSPAEPGVG